MRLSTRPSVALGLVVAALSAALAGCGSDSSGGGGGGDDTGGTTALSRAEIVEQANALCAAEETAGEKIEPPADIRDAEQAAAYFDQVDPLISDTTDKLAALEPDSEVAADWNAFVTLRQEFSAKMHQIREKADAADRSGLEDLQNLSSADLDAAAEKVGASSCGSDG